MKLKKVIKRVLVLIALMLFVFIALLKYRDYQSYKNTIPANADIILKINADKILIAIVKNAFGNPSHYFNSNTKKNTVKKPKRGFSIPANFFVFNLKEDPKTFYTILKLNDSSCFKKYVEKSMNIKCHSKSANYTFFNSKNIGILFNDKKAVLYYNYGGKNKIQDAEKLLLYFKTYTDLKKTEMLKGSDSHVCILKGPEDYLEMDFNNGIIAVKGELNNTYFQTDKNAELKVPAKDSYLYFSMYGKPSNIIDNSLNINDIIIPVDSIFNYYSGSVSLELIKNTTETDTIISYEYDDNFEKVVIKSTEDKKVPGIHLLFKGNGKKLQSIFRSYHMINDNRLNSKLFPLYQLKYKELNDSTSAFSNYPFTPIDFHRENYFAELYVNFDKLLLYNNLKIKALGKLKDLKIRAYKENGIFIKGNIQTKNRYLNSLVYLLAE